MKKILFILSFMYACLNASAQSIPQAINFQGVVYDSNGKVVYNSNKPYIVISVLQGSTILFTGNTNVNTNSVGAFSMSISQASLNVTTGNFDTIPWSSGSPKTMHIAVAYDGIPVDTVSYATISLATVPYAFAAETVQGVDFSNPTDGQVLSYSASSGKWAAQSLGGGLIAGNGVTITANTISINLVAGTGISISGNTITNTAPDQTVTINAGTGITVTGTYPNFTVSAPAPKAPTFQILNGGSGTYHRPTGPGPIYIKVKMLGGGGGGAGSGTSGSAGTNGDTTFFGTALLTANGGLGGGRLVGGAIDGGTGGTGIINSPAVGIALTGGGGGAGSWNNASAQVSCYGGIGGSSAFGGAGVNSPASYSSGGAGSNGVVNTGGGGSGASGPFNLGNGEGGGGGGSGAYIEAIIYSPSLTYPYSVAGSSAGGAAGGNGYAGGNGGSGVIIVEEYYQ